MNEISYSGPTNQVKRRFSKRFFVFLSLGIVILLLILGFMYFVVKANPKKEETKSIPLPSATEEEISEPTSTPTPEESMTPTKSVTKTPTPTKTTSSASTAKSDISVAVQNGSGESGVAAKAADILKAAGYTISSTGNADNFDYTNVTIQVKASKKSILAELKEDLSSDYTIEAATADLSEGQSYDALVIIGK